MVQLKRNESDVLLELRFRHVDTPEFHCRFTSQTHSMAAWDNRSAQHQSMFDDWPNRRYAHHVMVRGDKPFYRA